MEAGLSTVVLRPPFDPRQVRTRVPPRCVGSSRRSEGGTRREEKRQVRPGLGVVGPSKCESELGDPGEKPLLDRVPERSLGSGGWGINLVRQMSF